MRVYSKNKILSKVDVGKRLALAKLAKKRQIAKKLLTKDAIQYQVSYIDQFFQTVNLENKNRTPSRSRPLQATKPRSFFS